MSKASRPTILGGRGVDVWDGEPEGVYVPTAAKAVMECTSDEAEVFVAGAKYDEVLGGVCGPLRRAGPGAIRLGRHENTP